MAAGKEIRGKIKSVENTKKITKAMEMVAASKMRKAQERMRSARPYSEKIRTVSAHLAQANPEYAHPFLVKHEKSKKIGIIVVTTDKGLCGGLNTNVLRQVTNRIKEFEAAGNKVELVTIGNKGFGFMNRIGAKVVAHYVNMGDTPHLEHLIGPVKVLLDSYDDEQLDAVYICYTRFINTMKQEPVFEQLLPLTADKMEPVNSYSWDYLYEPDAKSVIDELLLRYAEALVYQAVVENMASEQAARMVAMKAATDNAGSVIGELKLIYNKTRQAAITKELSEIVAGAAAV
ncbi:AtpG F0F1-type ATP synthase, gamma subunit [Oxalobacteraceae bacterium]